MRRWTSEFQFMKLSVGFLMLTQPHQLLISGAGQNLGTIYAMPFCNECVQGRAKEEVLACVWALPPMAQWRTLESSVGA